MPKLSDTQLVILSAAAQRADLSVLPLPDSLNLKGGALNKVMDSLRNRGVISGALKKKLGHTVEATRTREVGPNKTGTKGSATTYRIVA